MTAKCEREEEESGEGVVVRDTTCGGWTRNHISGFEGSRAVPAGPFGRGNAKIKINIFMTFKRLYYRKI
jgi:hypothetical protein